MRLAWRFVLAGAVFVVVWMITAKAVFAHAVAGGAVPAQVRLASWMAGLFAGGVGGVVVLVGLLVAGKRHK